MYENEGKSLKGVLWRCEFVFSGRRKKRTGFVERYVPVLTNPTQEKLNTADGLDHSLVRRAFSVEVWCIPIKNVNL